ncbi:ppdK [Symbiodinium natans]|uniref:PpdK protein n=1 Tax=Symbiodinium natans TaxID=878477 RepID=A0A812SBG6_9DINO|nr:ppdK [Symbiodinium natans]
MRHAFRILLQLALAGWPAFADLERELYNQAKQSARLAKVEASPREILEFLTTKRRTANVALLLHDANCPHCRKALPELDRVAESFQSGTVVFAHVDCTHNKGAMQSEFNLKGFPGFLFWRQSDPIDDLVGQVFVIDSDVDFILRASRLSEIGKERDGARRALAGAQVTVKAVDGKDMTVQVEGPRNQLVWIPHETLLQQGRRLPYRRGDGVARYHNVWEKEPMTQFLQRMTQPLAYFVKMSTHVLVPAWSAGPVLIKVTSLPSASWADLAGEGPAVLLCAGTLTRGFLEAAVTHQLSMRAYHTSAECPLQGASSPGSEQVVVYVPAAMQWAAVKGRARAAAAAAGPEVVQNDGALLKWVSRHRLPGIAKLGLSSVYFFLNSGPSVLVAVDVIDHETNIMAETKIREVMKPKRIGEVDVYSYGEADRYFGVADGTLPGFTYFGVSPDHLPRVVVFDDSDHWVEDAYYLTVEKLPEHLPRVSRMWRMSSTPRGHALWIAKKFVALYLAADRHAAAAGYFGRVLVVLLLAVFLWASAHLLVWIARSGFLFFYNIIEGDEEATAKEQDDKKESKKDK